MSHDIIKRYTNGEVTECPSGARSFERTAGKSD